MVFLGKIKKNIIVFLETLCYAWKGLEREERSYLF